MKKQIFSILSIAASSFIFAQVGINNTTPQATMDITAKVATGNTATPEGLIIPRVDRERSGSMTSVATSTLIYVNSIATGAQTGININVNAIGFYYFDGSVWQKMGQGTSTTAPLNVTAELDANYTALATDDIILYNTTADRILTLPTSGIAVGKKYYISNIGSNGVTYSPLPRNSQYNVLGAGTSATIIYIGSGRWDVFTGY